MGTMSLVFVRIFFEMNQPLHTNKCITIDRNSMIYGYITPKNVFRLTEIHLSVRQDSASNSNSLHS